jgi:hypothetical protein
MRENLWSDLNSLVQRALALNWLRGEPRADRTFCGLKKFFPEACLKSSPGRANIVDTGVSPITGESHPAVLGWR